MGKLYTASKVKTKSRHEECRFFQLQCSEAKINQNSLTYRRGGHFENMIRVHHWLGNLNVRHVITPCASINI